ncbi:AraC family transcriptional regulator [Sediminicola luteus]|uniref:HTH araC/xylS-type domain-containing protein n=1 Tax=Sediminicola luteus TaxID=319238 RepID=A0A2A4G1I2_9FLAO|nr:AraC family transcriptional regulator [Sediminicola luteus]PCE62547.1 hypothetical protein B7P33_18085 [Sediminicola luteus]
MDNLSQRDGFMGQKMIVLPDSLKKRFRENPIIQNFHLTDIGYFPRAMRHKRTREHGSDEYIFMYCVEGEGWYQSEGERHHIGPNQFLIIPKNTPHTYGSALDNPWSLYWIHFKGTLAGNLYKRYTDLEHTVVSIPYQSRRVEQFKNIYSTLTQSYLTPPLEYVNLSTLSFISLFVYDHIAQKDAPEEIEDIVESIIVFLEANLERPLKTDDITKEFNYSASYIFSIFKKRTGYSLINYFNLKKIQKACEYLQYSDLNIKEISYKMGFQDPLYFSRSFKKHMGMSPKKYKLNV